MQHFECCQNALEASNLVKTCFLTSVLTWERLSFTFQTHNSHLLDPHFSTIFNIQKCNNFVVFSDSANASEKVDLVLFLWSSRLVETYPKTSFIKNLSFLTLFSAPYTWGATTKTSQSTTFFASSSKIEHFDLIIIDSIWSILIQTNLFFDVVSFLWATRLVKMYPKTSFDKTGGFWKL